MSARLFCFIRMQCVPHIHELHIDWMAKVARLPCGATKTSFINCGHITVYVRQTTLEYVLFVHNNVVIDFYVAFTILLLFIIIIGFILYISRWGSTSDYQYFIYKNISLELMQADLWTEKKQTIRISRYSSKWPTWLWRIQHNENA